ncbi:hypothetical protein [Rhizobium wenxiniae]|uniref:hypothetical protein n=1 Tax=Rhizobium wenxiniae TaxID=1737357 RepID=UPI001CB78A80|nr:hypothetical protein [Rhizobium wenxiniae]
MNTTTDEMSRQDAAPVESSTLSRLFPAAALYWLVTAAVIALISLPKAKDLIGPDNDDVMRLVEIRDWFGGQGWFDLMQYRLGLSGGTLMHWSRFIDAPIGGLIKLFSFFMPMEMAEGVAASVWPLLLVGPLLLAFGFAGRRMGGEVDGPRVMHIALGLGALFAFTCMKFRPGALDHHNVQLVLAIGIAALLADRRGSALGHAAGGIATALAIAIGAETVPLVAVVCLCVGARWVWQGAAFAAGARAFGVSLAFAITVAFFATVPPSAYAAVTCDSLSLGFYSLSALGGAGLFGLACLPARIAIVGRLAASVILGAILGVAVLLIAPQCLGSPLANLDPMLVELWLNNVIEAQSIFGQAQQSPETVAGFYTVGLFAILVCVFRIWRGDERGLHLLFLVLIAASWAVSLIQVRGSLFANLLSIPPLALLIADLQKLARENQKSLVINLGFVVATLASVPAVWGGGGVIWKKGPASASADVMSMGDTQAADECGAAEDMAALRSLPPGTIAAPSNRGAGILRFTQHRVLSAPYHRNQGGMLAELHIGMAKPEEALPLLKRAGVTVVAFCKSDPQTENLIQMHSDGLYASLARGTVPAYLSPVQSGGKFQLFLVNQGDPK